MEKGVDAEIPKVTKKQNTTKKKKSKVGEPCKEPADCQNNNCVNNVCTRKNAKKVKDKAQNKTKNQRKWIVTRIIV